MANMRDFAKNVTFHGMLHILTSKRLIVKIYWLIMFLGSLGYLVYQVSEIGGSYMDHPVMTKIETRIQKQLRFPSVTFCPTDAMKRMFSPKYDNYSMADRTTKDFLDQIDQGTSLVLSYSFRNRKYNYSNHFRRILIPNMGLCYSFNPDGTLFQDRPGSLFGLQLALFVNSSEYGGGRGRVGVYVSVHPHDELPFPDFDSIGLSPGFSNIIRLEKTTMIRQGSPYPSNCTKGGDANLVFPGKYSVKNCEMSCIESEPVTKCRMPYFWINRIVFLNHSKSMTSNFVNESAGKKCFEKNNISSRANTFLHTKCNCQSPCHEITYEKLLSFLRLPDDKFLSQFAAEWLQVKDSNIFGLNVLRDSLLEVFVYFGEMSERVITEKPEWTITKVLSDIGGQMGIWLGASIFSLVEILILIGYIPFGLLRDRKNEKMFKRDDDAELPLQQV